MARLQSQDYASKKADIQRAATQLFAQKGFHASSIIDIARASGYTKTRLYHYFPSKEQLLYEILRSHAETLNQKLLPILGNGKLEPRQRLEAFTKALLEQNVKSRAEHKLILSELDSLPGAQRNEITTLLREPIAALFASLMQINPALAKNAKLHFPSAMMFLGMVNWAHTWFSEDGSVSIDKFTQMVCDTFLDGYKNTDLS